MEYIAVCMVRGDMEGIPQHPLPEGYSMRLYRPGDRETWLRVQRAWEPFERITEDMFDRTFGVDLPAMERRGYFLIAPDGHDVGTITAWYERRFVGRPWGRIHWVAIASEHRGKGLSRCIMTVAMNRLRALGHRRAMLTTQTPRIAAIRTYLHFGFVPDMSTERAAHAWKLVAECIDHPALKGT
jgi:GNAT superfamily N-acetyltransferase